MAIIAIEGLAVAWGWNWLRGHWAGPDLVLQGHEDGVTSVAASPDGRWLVSGSLDRSVRVWDMEAGTPKHVLTGHKEAVLGVAYSPVADKALSTGLDYSLRLWDVVQGQEEKALRQNPASKDLFRNPLLRQPQDGAGSWIQFSQDGKQALHTIGLTKLQHYVEDTATGKRHGIKLSWSFFGRNNVAQMIDLPDGRSRWELEHERSIMKAIFLPGGKQVLSAGKIAGQWVIVLWETRDDLQAAEKLGLDLPLREVRQFAGHTDVIWSLSARPDGKRFVSAGFDDTVRVWDVATGKEVRQWKPPGAVYSAVYAPDGRRILTGGGDGVVRLWDAEEEKEICRFRGHEFGVSDLIFVNQRRAVSASWDKTIRVWRLPE